MEESCLLARFLLYLRPTCPGLAPPTVDSAPPTSIIHLKNVPRDIHTSQSDGCSSSVEVFLFLDNSDLCHIYKIQKQTTKNTEQRI